MNSITDYLASIEAREKKATPGRWRVRMGGSSFAPPLRASADPAQVLWYSDQPSLQQKENFEFAAHARTDIPALIALVRKYREALEHISDAACAYDDNCPSHMSHPRCHSCDARDALQYDPREVLQNPAMGSG